MSQFGSESNGPQTVLKIVNDGRVRLITLSRPEALNAFNEALYDETTEALMAAADDPSVAVVILTGEGRAFSAGTDVVEMADRAGGAEVTPGRYGFPGLIDGLTAFPKPLIAAVNGLALGIGATLLGFADLVLMSTEARIRCPFTDLAVAPEAASSYWFPLLLGRQQATWVLMSSEWFSGAECVNMGLALRLCEPAELLPEATKLAQHLAGKPLASLIETKRTIVAGHAAAVAGARARENTAFKRLLGGPASMEALAALAERRTPDFEKIDSEYPVDVSVHWQDGD